MQCKILNVDDYVEKPISPDILLQRVERIMKREGKLALCFHNYSSSNLFAE